MIVDFSDWKDVFGCTTFLERFHKWRDVNRQHNELDIEDQFSLFYKRQTVDKTQFEVNCDFAFQMYCIQECMEGLMEDE